MTLKNGAMRLAVPVIFVSFYKPFEDFSNRRLQQF